MPEYPQQGHPGGGHHQQPPQEYRNGTLILILGIVGLVACAPLGIAAWVMGHKAIKEIDASGITYTNRGVVNAGRIIGIIATVLMIIGTLVFFFSFGSILSTIDGSV